MKAIVRKTYTITLTEEEAYWLRSLVQNPVSVDEPIRDSQIRENIFLMLEEVEE